MTRYTNKRKRWRYTAPRETRSQRHLRTIEWMQEHGLLNPETADDVVIRCEGCGRYCFGWQWGRHEVCVTVKTGATA